MEYKAIKPEYKLTRRERVLIHNFIQQAPEKPMDHTKHRGWKPFGKWKLCWVDNETISIERWDVDPWVSRTITSDQIVKVIKEKTDESKRSGILGFNAEEENPVEGTGFSGDGIQKALEAAGETQYGTVGDAKAGPAQS